MRVLEREALRAGFNRALAIARSHYGDTINLEGMSLGYTPGYGDEELEEMEAVLVHLS